MGIAYNFNVITNVNQICKDTVYNNIYLIYIVQQDNAHPPIYIFKFINDVLVISSIFIGKHRS